MTDPTPAGSRLEYFPISFFAMVMGLSGLTIGWEKAQHVLGWQLGIIPLLAGGTLLIFALLALLYGAKVLRFRAAVLAELRHPVKLNFFPAISISLLLLSIAFLPLHAELARWESGLVHPGGGQRAGADRGGGLRLRGHLLVLLQLRDAVLDPAAGHRLQSGAIP